MYIIVDAIDECLNKSGTPSPRESVLHLLNELIQLHHPDLHIGVTSRPEPDIETILRPLSTHLVSLHDESGQNQDIVDYVRAVVNSDQKMRKWSAENCKDQSRSALATTPINSIFAPFNDYVNANANATLTGLEAH